MSSINPVSNTTPNYSTQPAKKADSKPSEAAAAEKEEAAATYTPSNETAVDTAKKTYTPNTELVEQLKSTVNAQTEQLRSIVEKLISGQGSAFAAASGDDIWSFLAKGDFKNIDEAARAQAQKDISEGGYWSVDETSKRILDFAKALTGGDPSKIETMRDAFKKGFDQAKAAWGKDNALPDISSKTYDAVMKGFDDWANESKASESKVSEASPSKEAVENVSAN